MKVLATFDGSKSSEAILPQLEWLARMPDTEFTLLLIAHQPHETAGAGRPPETPGAVGGLGAAQLAVPVAEPALIEDRGEAIDRVLAERRDYLHDLVSRMPTGPQYSVEAAIADDITGAIVRYAIEHQPDVIVMGTHGETGMIHRLFGDTAEGVVRSGVAPVLLVHSVGARRPVK